MNGLRLLLLALFCSVLLVGHAESETNLLRAVNGRLLLNEGITGSFQQEKHLTFMRQPLVSTGQFTLRRNQGLYWKVLEPVASLMVVRDGTVTLDGKQISDRGVGELLADIMLGFISGKLQGLEQNFHVSGDVLADGWALQLQPRTYPLSQVLSHIELEGDSYLSRIRVVERSGNRTDMHFSEISQIVPPE